MSSAAARSKAHRERNRQADRWHHAVRSLAVRSASKQRGKGKAVRCDISAQEILEMGERQGFRCYFTGIPFHLIGGSAHPAFPSLDRQDVNGDYSVRNCRLTCWWANRGRADLPAAEFLALLQDTVESFATAPYVEEYHRLFLPRPPRTP